ncbi:MAG: methionine--tRNA ligase [Muribaculaceae bacterium]|nr:methionine--tRNA ligase [Muribaculaceae bacterium]
MKQYKRTLITTALPYANGPVHIGHLAGVYVPADIYARYLRLQGRPVTMVGGSDEHGVPITIKAKKEGVTPQDVVDRYHSIIKDSFKELGISFDIYSRTTSSIHAATASEFFSRLHDKGEFIEQTSTQLYDPEAHMFLADRYVTGECPHCHSPRAYGDQCEACGTSLNATDLIDPKSALSGATPELRQTKHWFLPLDRFQERLSRWILEGHKEWRPNVYGQCKSWLDLGLQPRAVTRDLDWGVPVPLKEAEGKVLYVWFDAPIGYISNTKELYPDSWETWWKDPETRIINFIGKDNIVFHCIVFPAMLMAYGDGFQLPDNVPSNEFLNLEGDKISTSRNWAVWLHEYLREFPGKQDTLRYVLTANAPETKDNDFTWADFQTRNNSELVAILGNFINRATVLTHKYYGGSVPVPGEMLDAEKAVFDEIDEIKKRLTEQLEGFHFRDALREAMNIARAGNKYLQETEPWKVWKTDQSRVATILYTALQICADIAIAFEPFTPFMSDRLSRQLGISQLCWAKLGTRDLVKSGTVIAQPELLFEKIEDHAIAAQLAKLEEAKRQNIINSYEPAAVKESTSFEDFEKTDIRVGTVTACSKVKKSNRLLQLSIDDGMGGRTILSGIAQSYPNPEELVGKQVCFIANFPPRKMMGIESQGMVLSAVDADGRLVVVGPTAPVAPGASVG